MMPTAAFATEPEPTPTPEPTSIVDTTPTPDPSESPENTDATVSTSAPGTGTGSTSAPEATPAGNTDDTKEPVESPEPSEEPTDDTTESGEEGTETTDSTTVPSEENVEQQVSVPQTLAAAPTADGEPETQAAGNNIYENPEKGIYITFEDTGGSVPRTVHFIITENGNTLQTVDVEGFRVLGNDVTIIAPGYRVSTSLDGEGGFTPKGGNLYWLLPTSEDCTAHIDLVSVKDGDNVSLGDYGTFSWEKANADTDQYERNVTIYVDGVAQQETYTVYTPENLTNTGTNDQFWFTPNVDKYNTDYQIKTDGDITGLTLGNTPGYVDFSVYLTTKCPCGRTWCECPGGGCGCIEECPCDQCNPQQAENEIRTPYGSIEYTEDLEDGYKLTVELYVNGQLRETVKGKDGNPLRISAGVIDGLNFEPTDGYYYYYDTNSYDIDTAHGGIWHPRTGMVTIVPGDGAKDYDNVLKIYLWTFQNHSKLDVERRVDVGDKVKGYTISYKAYNPETKRYETFTYEATSFLVAQPQMVPTNTEVTITPICESPYEVEHWSTADAYSAVTLRGERSQQGTNAYGNKVYLTVGNTAYVSMTLYIESLREVKVPEDDELINNKPDDDPEAPYFDGNVAVVVDCVNESAQHNSESFTLMADRFTVSALKGDSASGYYAEVTITNPQAYVDTYNAIYQNYTHTLSESQDELVITLRWVVVNNESVWKADGPATIKVTCEDEPEPGIDPTEPDPSELTEAVNVYCSTFPDTHKQEVYNILRTQDNDLDVEWSKGETTATITIKDSDPYVDKYNEDNPPQDKDNPHVFDEDWKNNDLTISLKWVDDAWKVEDPADIYVCDKYKDGTPIQVSVYLDGENVTANWKNYLTLGGNTDKTKNFVYTYNESTNTIECKYVYQTYNSADMVIEAKDAYKLQALDADLMYGSAGSDGYNTTTGVLDNVAGGSEVKIYLATEYSVEYYVDGKKSDTITDGDTYTVLDDAAPEEDLTNIPNEKLGDEEKDDLDPENGMQKVYAVVWVADDLEDTITLEDTTGLNAWYPKWDAENNTVDGTQLGDTVGLATILRALNSYTVENNVIKFFGETENPDVTVTKSLFAINRNGDSVKVTDDIELKVGDELTYVIEIVNSGNVDLEELTVTDTFNGHLAPSAVKDAEGQELSAAWAGSEGSWTWEYTISELKVGEYATYTYTYTVNQADAGNKLTNTAAVTGDELDPENPPEDKDEHEVTNDGDITLQPADITIYMGGEDGYAGAAGGDSNSLPEPGFYITLPDEVKTALQNAGYPNGEAADLSKIITGVTATTKDGQTRSWTMQMYGESASTAWINNQEHFVYRIVPGTNQPKISVNFTKEDGTPVTEDKFTLTDSLSETYGMSLNTASVDVKTISLTFDINGEIFHCGYDAKNSQEGTLTVRYTTTPDAPSTKAVTDLAAEVQKDPEQFYVQVENDQNFYINEKSANEDGVDVTAKDVSLLVDSLVGGEDYAYTNALYSKAVTAAGFKSSGVWGQYLDLVDAENGNAWLTPEGEVTVFWPYPAGVTKDTGTIKLYHFEGLDRDMATDDVIAEINNTNADEVPITRLDDGFTFKTSSFSPFVLVQNTTQPSGGEDKPSGGDNGNNDNNNNNTNTNNQTTTVNVANQAAAPAAAPAAVSVPQTSDDMPIGALTAAAVAAAAALVGLLVVRKRRQK